MEDEAAEAHEWDYEEQFERIDDVVSYLRGGHVEAEDKGHCEAENGRAADDGIDADEETDGDAPGEFLWSCSRGGGVQRWAGRRAGKSNCDGRAWKLVRYLRGWFRSDSLLTG